MTDWTNQPNYNNDVPLEKANVQKHSTGATHLKEVISGTNVVKIVTAALADLCVTTEKIAALAVTTAKIANDAVTTVKILNGNVTLAKLATVGNVGDLLTRDVSGWVAAPLSAALDDLSDVTAPTPSTGHSLVWNGTAWVNQPIAVAPGSPGQTIVVDAGGNVVWKDVDETWNILFDGGGSDIAAGTTYTIQYDDNFDIQQWAVFSKQSGSIQIDIWKSAALPGGYPPVDANSITGGNEPGLTAMDYAADAVLTGWNKTLEAGRVLTFNVDSCTGIQVCTLALKVRRTD